MQYINVTCYSAEDNHNDYNIEPTTTTSRDRVPDTEFDDVRRRRTLHGHPLQRRRRSEDPDVETIIRG